MGNYEQLKEAIMQVIRQNGRQEITGKILQDALIALVNNLAANYMFAGVATPDTEPGTPDANVYYLTAKKGDYTHFGIQIDKSDITVIKNVNNKWVAEQLGFDVIAGGGVTDYTELENKPQINGMELSGNKTAEELGLNDIYVVGDVTSLTNESTPEEIMAVLGEPNKLIEAVEGGKLICFTDYNTKSVKPIRIRMAKSGSNSYIGEIHYTLIPGFPGLDYINLGIIRYNYDTQGNNYALVDVNKSKLYIPSDGFIISDAYTINKDTYDYLNTELFEKTHIYFTKGNICDVTAETNGSDLMNIMGDYWTDDFDIQNKIDAGIQLFSIATDKTNHQRGLIPVTVSYYIIDRNITFSYIKNGKLVVFTTKISIDTLALGDVLTYKEIDLTNVLTKTVADAIYQPKGDYATTDQIEKVYRLPGDLFDFVFGNVQPQDIESKIGSVANLKNAFNNKIPILGSVYSFLEYITLSIGSGVINLETISQGSRLQITIVFDEESSQYEKVETVNRMTFSVIPEVIMSFETTFEGSIKGNKFYLFNEPLTSLTITSLEGQWGEEHMLQFSSGDTPTVLTLPEDVKWIGSNTVDANKTYQLSIVNNLAVMGGA